MPSVAYTRQRHFCGTAQLIPKQVCKQIQAHLLLFSLPAAGVGVAASDVDMCLEREVLARETFRLLALEGPWQNGWLVEAGLIGTASKFKKER